MLQIFLQVSEAFFRVADDVARCLYWGRFENHMAVESMQRLQCFELRERTRPWQQTDTESRQLVLQPLGQSFKSARATQLL